MTQRLQLTEQRNPLSQTFRVVERDGSVLTGVGLFFYSTPSVSVSQIPITVELRPVVNGAPSSTEFFPGTQVTVAPSVIRSKASTTFSSATEHKFTFREPIYIPGNTEVALVAYTSAPAGQWKIWAGEIGEFVAGSTTKRISKQLDAGVVYESSNGTAWNASQYLDLAFKVYRAVFTNVNNIAHLEVDTPPLKRLTETNYVDNYSRYPRNPLSFTAASNKLRVLHPNHGFNVDDRVYITGIDSADTINGVKGASIVGTKLIDSADPFGYTVTMDSAATATLRAGGSNVIASEQHVINAFGVVMPRSTPQNTSVQVAGNLTTHKSFAGSETPYQPVENVAIELDKFQLLDFAGVVASAAQEADATKLNGQPSTTLRVLLATQNKYVAPYFDVSSSSFRVVSNMIDYAQSNDSSDTGRNYTTTIPYVSETQASSGTSASKHITIPYALAESATSIRVYVDAMRPTGAEFTVWYRTAVTSEETPITEKAWTAFSKTINPPNKSNYSQNGNHNSFKEYEFNVYDVPDFDQYQIKITFHSTNSSHVPYLKNLRTIATV